MIEKITREQVKEDDWGWIQMRSPVLHNKPYGTLAVFTDGLMHPGKGFDMHPHRNIEIVSVILEGEVKHQDSTGNITKMPAGSVQRITAGAGIYHAEHTASPEAVRMYQIWFVPHTNNLKPEYTRTSYKENIKKNELYPIVTHTEQSGTLTMHADGIIYMADFEANHQVSYSIQSDRKLFVFVAEGSLRVNQEILNHQDHARIEQIEQVKFESITDTQFIIIDIPLVDKYLY